MSENDYSHGDTEIQRKKNVAADMQAMIAADERRLTRVLYPYSFSKFLTLILSAFIRVHPRHHLLCIRGKLFSLETNIKNQCRLYDDLTWTWPIISPPEDYVEETEELCQAIYEYSRIEVKTLLNLGCGGGHNDYTLKKHFDVTGIDLSASMLSLAKRLNPEVAYLSGDMRSVRLGKSFDAVVITDAITYMLTEDDLQAAFKTAFTHLKPGGVFFTFAEVTRENFQQNSTGYSVHTKGDIEITFIENVSDPDPTDTTYQITFVYLIRRKGQTEVEVKTDRHLGGIFDVETWIRLLKKVGFEVEQIALKSYDFPTFICLKPLECKF